MTETSTKNIMQSTDRIKRRRLSNPILALTQRYRCDKCDIGFTTHRAYLRHRRENRKHRSESIANSEFTCGQCGEGFARSHDRDRHTKEQHEDGKAICVRCGKRLRRNAPHTTPGGEPCDSMYIEQLLTENLVPRDYAERTEESQSSPKVAQPKMACKDDWLRKLESRFSNLCVSNQNMYSNAYAKQAGARHPRRYLPCGICRSQFEMHDTGALLKHLNNHFNNLRNKHQCDICQIGFSHAEDLQMHVQSAERGNCGFSFHHNDSCSGHHPPGERIQAFWETSEELPRTDTDRFNFSVRLWYWEQSQLRAFMNCVDAICEGYTGRGRATAPVMFVEISKPSGRNTAPGQLPPSFAAESPATCCACKAVDFLEWRYVLSTTFRSKLEDFPRCRNTWGSGSCPWNNNYDLNEALTFEMLVHTKQSAFGTLPKSRSSLLDQFSEGYSEFEINSSTGFEDDWPGILHRAALAGDAETLQLVIACGVDVNIRDFYNRTALHLAIACGSLYAVEVLLEKGAKAYIKDGNGNSPILLALQHGSAAILFALLRHGNPFNDPFNDILEIFNDFCNKQDLRRLQTLLSHFDSQAQDLHGTPLTEPSILENILFKALVSACGKGRLDVVRLLVDHGANINRCMRSKLDFDANPLLSAISHRRVEIIEYLLANGADLDRKLSLKGIERPLGVFALHYASRNGQSKVIELLLDQGCHVNGEQVDKHTLLCNAASSGWLDCVQMLLQNGASLEVKCESRYCATALTMAASRGHYEIVEYLIHQEIDVNAQDDNGCTALCGAVVGEDHPYLGFVAKSEIVKILQGAGATRQHCSVPTHEPPAL